MKKRSVGSILYLSAVLAVLYLPIVIVVLYSFNDNPSRIPLAFTGFTTRWYHQLFTSRNNYGDALLLSLNVAFWSVLVSTVIGTLGAIGMAQRTLRGKAKASWLDTCLETLITLPIMIPEIILGLAFLVVFNAAGFQTNEVRLVLAHTTFCIPYIFLTVKSRLVGMDVALFDAARDLGASPGRVMLDITLPLCRPAIISGAFLAAAMSLDDFVISFFVYGAGQGTLPILIYSSVKVGVSTQVNALCTLLIAAAFLLVAISRYVSAVRKSGRKKPASA